MDFEAQLHWWVTWQKTYGGVLADRVMSVQPTTDGGCIAAGETNSFGTVNRDAWLLKLGTNGTVVWDAGSGASTQVTTVVGTNSTSASTSTPTISTGNAVTTSQDTTVTPTDTSATVRIQATPDATPPATITDLATSNPTSASITLTWTAPGNNSMKRNATGYILKYSTSGQITAANWDSATTYNQTWTPAKNGTTETHTISWIPPSTHYWFAIKAYDIIPNYSGISNSPSGTTTDPPPGSNWAITYHTTSSTYGSTPTDDKSYAQSVQHTSDGGYIVAGYTTTSSGNYHCAWVLKLNSSGGVTWQKAYGNGSSFSYYANSIKQTTDGGYIVAGYSTYPYTYGVAWVLKLDSTGGVTWQKAYGNHTGYARAQAVQQTSDGGYIVAGATQVLGTGYAHVWVFKLTATGDVTWQKIYADTDSDEADSVQQTSDGGYIVAGYTDSFGAGGWDALVLKLDSDGSVTWQKTYGGADDEFAYSVQQTSDGGYIVAGYTGLNIPVDVYPWVLRIDSMGSIMWQRLYGELFYSALSVGQTSDGGFVAACANAFGGVPYFLVLKLDYNGWIVPNEGYERHTVTVDSVPWSYSLTEVTYGVSMDSRATMLATSITPRNSSVVVQDTQENAQDTHAQLKVLSEWPDWIPPRGGSPFYTLTASTLNTTAITLTWTAPGDDDMVGNASGYVLKYSTSELTVANWSSATTYNQTWIPAKNGTLETHIISDLEPSTTYWFALVAYDDYSNYSNVTIAHQTTATPQPTGLSLIELVAFAGIVAGAVAVVAVVMHLRRKGKK